MLQTDPETGRVLIEKIVRSRDGKTFTMQKCAMVDLTVGGIFRYGGNKCYRVLSGVKRGETSSGSLTVDVAEVIIDEEVKPDAEDEGKNEA